MATTSAAPISIPQINHYYYVGQAMLRTIQQAVTFAVADSNAGTVVIPQEYAGTDSISAVSSGSATVFLMDERNGQRQIYNWNGTSYVPTDFEPLGAIAAGDATFATCTVDESPVRTFANTPDGSGGDMIWPDIGVPVSLGSAWQSPSIPAADIARLSSGSTIFAGDLAAATLNVIDSFQTGTHALISAFQTEMAAGAITGMYVGITDSPLNYVQIGFAFSALNSAANLGVVGFPGGSQATFDNSGNWIFPGTIRAGSTAALAGGLFRIGNRGTGTEWATGGPNINTDGNSVIINPVAGQGVFLNWDGGGAAVNFGGGNQNIVANINSTGDAHFNGTVTAGVKSFRITHPLDDTKDLTHSCIEGPEIAVYYRGETETVDGVAVVELPDYFEALTLLERRNVQLTQIFVEDEFAFSQLAASRVVDGKFKIRSSEASVMVSWEVMAVRADIPELEIVTDKETIPITALPSGQPQAGGSKPKADGRRIRTTR